MGLLVSSEEDLEELKTKWQPLSVENTMLSWIAIASIFFVLSGTAVDSSTNERNARTRKYYIAFIIIGFIILVITAFDYMSIRRTMKLEGRSPYRRTDYLFAVLMTTIVIIALVILEELLVGVQTDSSIDINEKCNTKNKYEENKCEDNTGDTDTNESTDKYEDDV